MRRFVHRTWLALAIATSPCVLLAQGSPVRSLAETVVVLITEQEAALTPTMGPVALAGVDIEDRAISRNPKIVVESPSAAAASPLHFEIRFIAFNGAQIEPSRVKLTYLKQSPIDLTPRVAAFIRQDGIDVPRAQVAAGKHLLQIDVVDTQGRQASRQLTLDVGQ